MHKLLLIAAAIVHQATAAPAPVQVASYYPQEWSRYSVWTQAGPAEPNPQACRALDVLIQTKHQVSSRDNINSIAKEYGTTVKSLQSTNQNEFIVMRPGGYIRVMNKTGFLYEVTAKAEKLGSILDRYFHGGDRDEFRRKVIDENNLPPSDLITDAKLPKGTRLLLPDTYISIDAYHIPMEGALRISSGFGYRNHPVLHRILKHQGIDIPRPYGFKVYPSRSGTVSFAGWSGGYGNMVEITHPNGESTRYGHLSKIEVKVGDKVAKDSTLIGLVGDTGMTTGPHLHFEIRDRHGVAVNPLLKLGKS
jgi:murein DD-endopeptidase MepM/ murein hydrolase activator NlpD